MSLEAETAGHTNKDPDASLRLGERILLIDGHVLLAESLRSILTKRGLVVIGIATTADMGLREALEHEPDLVLVALNLQDGSGLELGKSIVQHCPNTKVVITGASYQLPARQLLREGLHGCITSDTAVPDFVAAVTDVLNEGCSMVRPRSTSQAPPVRRSNEDLKIDQLTEREREILGFLVRGVSGVSIATQLGISPNTVRSHIQNILTKLQVRSRLEAAAFAARNRVMPLYRS